MSKKARSAGRPGSQAEKPEAREQRGVLTRVNPEGLKSLRLLAIERDTTLQALGIEAWNDLLAKYGRKGNVRNPLLE